MGLGCWFYIAAMYSYEHVLNKTLTDDFKFYGALGFSIASFFYFSLLFGILKIRQHTKRLSPMKDSSLNIQALQHGHLMLLLKILNALNIDKHILMMAKVLLKAEYY